VVPGPVSARQRAAQEWERYTLTQAPGHAPAAAASDTGTNVDGELLFVRMLFGGDADRGAGGQAEVTHGFAVGDSDGVEAQVEFGGQVERHPFGSL
jgi:hypothetical protein